MLQLRKNIDASHALDLAKFQRPGVKLSVGPEMASELKTNPGRQILQGPHSWFELDCARLIGRRELSLWVLYMCVAVVVYAGRMPTAGEVDFFSDSRTTLKQAQEKILSLE